MYLSFLTVRLEFFREMAREWKIEHHGRNARPDHEKLDCFGIPVVNHDSYEVIQKENRPHLENRVRDFAEGFLKREVDFILASFQSMFEDPDEMGYQPGTISKIFDSNVTCSKVWIVQIFLIVHQSRSMFESLLVRKRIRRWQRW